MPGSNIIEYDEPVRLTFVRKWHEYDDVYSFEFLSGEKLPFLAGQNARIVIPGLQEEVAAHSLSFANAPEEQNVLFSMHTHSKSAFKQAMLELKEGDAVHLVKIKGETVLPDDTSRPVVLIAGGVGMTPFRSILRHIAVSGLPTQVVLIHVSRGEYLYRDEFLKLDCVQHYITRQDIEVTLEEAVRRHANAMHYIAGPPPFIESVKKILYAQDISELSVRMSRFTGYENQHA